MKVSILVFLFVQVCFAQSEQPFLKFDRPIAVDTICKRDVDLSKNKTYFTFSNSGKKPVIITRVVSGDPDFACYYPREPILPGKKDSIGICMVQQQLLSGMRRSYQVQYLIASEPELQLLELQLKRVVVDCKKD